ncbi:MAG: recombinase family protein, partial [Planctomycetota bacterium]
DNAKGFKAIADTLNREGVPTPRGPAWSHIYSGKWTDTTVRSILVNPAYAGDLVWNRRTDGRFHCIVKGQATERSEAHGARLVPNDPSDWMVVREAHPALISRQVFEQARLQRENQPTSRTQQGSKPRSSRRSRFILSGLLECARCGHRYQGYTRVKGQRRNNGSAVRSLAYACAGYITKGATVCQLNAVGQEQLEQVVADAILSHYRPYLATGGRKRLAKTVREAIGHDDHELAEARGRHEAEQQRVSETINNLLDNITEANREFVDQRLLELRRQREQLQARLEQLQVLSLSQTEVQAVVSDTKRFLSGLQDTLRSGVPEQKRTALRQCLERALVDKAEGTVKLAIRQVPSPGLPSAPTDTIAVHLR